jgi:hypothetical protein
VKPLTLTDLVMLAPVLVLSLLIIAITAPQNRLMRGGR